MQFDLIKEVLTGSITGYITNAIAIKMIFREYGIGKLKVGGIVVKTREEFIDNVSSLVERDIINPQTLSSDLEKESFRDSIKKFTSDLLNVHIYKNTGNLSLGEIKGFNSTIDKTESYIKDCVNQNVPRIFDNLCKNIYLKDLLNEKQIQHVSGEVFNHVLDLLDNKGFIEKAVVDFYNENQSLSFGEFFGNRLIDTLSRNFQQQIENFHTDLEDNYDMYIDNAFENTIQTLEINKILKGLEENLLQKRIIDFVDIKDNSNLSISLINKIKDFLDSNEGKSLINNFSRELHNLLKSIDKSVLDLLSDSLKDNIENFIKDKLQYAIKEIVLWIENNKGDIEGLIENAIDDTVESIDDGMKKNVINLVRDKFSNDVAKKFDIVSKITEYLDKNADIDSISKDITDIIIKYLREKTISDIIETLEKKEILTEESFSKFITYNLINYLEYIPKDYFCGLLNKKIEDIFNINLVNIFESHIKKPLISVVKDRYIYSENTTKLVNEQLIKSLKSINTSMFGQLITKEVLSSNAKNVKSTVIEALKSNETIIKNTFYNEIYNSIGDISLHGTLNDELKTNLLNEFIDEILNNINKVFDNCKDIDIKEVCEKINNVENINDVLTEYIVAALKNNLKPILEGNIKKSVFRNLHNLKDEELQVMVEEFMGKEMKPITVIGALLGGIVGIGMYFFDKSTAKYSYVTGTIISIVVYALVGWLTNVQALAMLFKPYTEKRLFGLKIPFTPGVIVSRKPKFAKSMSAFVDEELLKKSSMQELFSKNKELIHSMLKEVVSKDDYKVIGDLLNKNSDSISDKGYEYSKKFINTNKNKISNSLESKMANISVENMDFSNVKFKAEKEILEKVKESNSIIANKLDKFLRSECKASEIMPKELKALIEKELGNKIEEEINKLLVYINKEDKRNELLLTFSNRYENLVSKSISQVISDKEISRWKEYINNLVASKITSQETRGKILNWLEDVLERELNPSKKVEQLFGGFLVNIVKDNFNYIMENTIKSIIRGLQNNQQVIAEVAITTTRENLNFFELMGYNMLGGDEIISSIVDNLIKDKFPSYIESKKEELQGVLSNFIGNKICNSTIGDLDIKLERIETLNVINKFINDEKNVVALNNNLIKITDSMVNWITDIKLEEYLNILSIKQIGDLIEIFEDELTYLEKELGKNVAGKKEELIAQYTKFTYEIFEGLILSKKISNFTKEIDKDYINDISSKLSDMLYHSPSVKENTNSAIEALICDLKSKNIGQLLNLEELNNCILYILEQTVENEQINMEARTIIANVTKDITGNNLNIVDNDVKMFITNVISSSIVDSTEENFLNIVNSVDFKSITEKQINYMEPKEIEDLFNSFAKKYFNRLKLYGLGGAIFGLHWSVGVISLASYLGGAAKEGMKLSSKKKS